MDALQLLAPQMTDDILNAKVSENIRKIVRAIQQRSAAAFGPIDISTFLETAISLTSIQGGAQSVISMVFGSRQFPALAPESSSPADSKGALSIGLSLVFFEAYQIRAKTGGKDNFIGLRHIIFAAFTSSAAEILGEIKPLFDQMEINYADASLAIRDFVVRELESQESREAWNEIFAARGLPVMDNGPIKPIPPIPSPLRSRTGPEVALLGSDDPWSKDAVDRSGSQAEANALATMICAKQFVPPLAIGIFGNWGAGKSFFMRLVYDAVENRRTLFPIAASPGADVDLLENVVQIRFNAWHYAETNLWASLVEHIFTSLDRWAEAANQKNNTDQVFDRLATARRLTIESAEMLVQARQERADAEHRLQDANRNLIAKKDEFEKKPSTWTAVAFQKILTKNSAGARVELEKAAQILGFGPITSSVKELCDAGASLSNAAASYDIVRFATLSRLTLPGVVFALTVLVILAPAILTEISALVSRVTEIQIPLFAAAVSGALAPIVAVMGWTAKRAQLAAAHIRNFHNDLVIEVEFIAASEAVQLAEAKKHLEEATAKVSQAEDRLRIASNEAAHAANEYNLKSGKGRVLRFVRERVTNGDYAKHLSFIAMVRKDFEELSALMSPNEDTATAEKARLAHALQVQRMLERSGEFLDDDEKAKLKSSVNIATPDLKIFERIVLYVDDLDRCQPKEVVAVLQAIHLLLTFPLFVVMVAVDVRWVHEALTVKYQGQIEGRDENRRTGTATASDYLEKIFQIPYWVRQMTADNTRALLEDRLGIATVAEVVIQPAAARTPADVPAKIKSGQASTERGGPVPVPLRLSGLRITPPERDFMLQIASVLDHSPRRTLRFINSYRLIKASLIPSAADDLEATGYRALMTLLAIGTCSAGVGTSFISSLCRRTTPSIVDDAENLSSDAVRVASAYKLYGSDPTLVNNLYDYAPLVSRFTFDTH